jgi:hypothetical protein
MFLTPWLRSIGQRLRSRKRRKTMPSEPLRKPQPRAAVVETLEDRTMLTVDITSVATAAGTATFTGDQTAADEADALVLSVSGGNLAHNLQAIGTLTYDSSTDFDPGTAGIQSIAAGSGTSPLLTVNLLGGNDSLTIDHSGGDLQGVHSITFNGGTGSDTLVGPNIDNTFNITGSNSGNVGGAGTIDFSAVDNLNGGNQKDAFNVTAASSFNLAGGANNDTFDIDAELTGAIDGEAGSDTLQGDNIDGVLITTLDANGADGTEASVSGNFSNIQTLTGNAGTLTGLAAASTWGLDGTPTYTSGGFSVGFSGFATLQGGTNADAFNVTSASRFNLNGG